jgi:hypothetical protein
MYTVFGGNLPRNTTASSLSRILHMGDDKNEKAFLCCPKGHHQASKENNGSVVYKYGVLGLACYFVFEFFWNNKPYRGK